MFEFTVESQIDCGGRSLYKCPTKYSMSSSATVISSEYYSWDHFNKEMNKLGLSWAKLSTSYSLVKTLHFVILKGTGLKIDIGIGVGGLHCILCNVIQNLTICLFQAQSRFGLVLSWVGGGGWVGGVSPN